MTEDKQNTEKKILEAAKEIFVEYGFNGASMQKIADRAGINKALLHYYFRSKEKLFEATFREVFFSMVPPLINTVKEEKPLEEKIRVFVEKYIDTLRDNPLVPLFILHELNRNPENLPELVKESGIDPTVFISQINSEIDAGNINPVFPHHLFINILALSIFPFVAKPIIKGLFFNRNEEEFNKFIEERKEIVTTFVLNAIKKP
jgi:AcrR family transcriptional regulator